MSAAEATSFLEATLPAQIRAEIALHNGEVGPRLSTWSHQEPVTVFGAGVPVRQGWDNVRPVFEWVASQFATCDDYEFDLIIGDASGDLAYTVGIERYTAVTATGERVRTALRATHVYRREGGQWRIAHRHGDHMPPEIER